MSGVLWELLDLLARWVHVIAGTMWVGNSLLFNWLDRNLLAKPPGAAGGADGVGATRAHGTLGQIWLLHSGAFYFVEKSLLAGQPLPKPLHWFKWQAYTTWLSGAALLIVVYYLGGRAVLAESSVAPLTHARAVCVGVGAIVGGWMLYEAMQRFVAPRAPRVALAVWVSGLVLIAVALTQLLSGRAAFLHVGAMLGTIMAANVFLTIVPSQRELVTSVADGRGASSVVSARAKRVSIHNNYFTFPVIVLMVSGHFPAVYGGRFGWALMFVLIAAGAAVRHVLNVRFTTPSWQPVLGATITASVAATYLLLQAGSAAASVQLFDSSAPVSFAEARHVIDRRCGACHSAHPSDPTIPAAPLGVMYDTPEQIVMMAPRMRERAVVLKTMPPGNKTGITEEERAVLGRWITQGAKVR